MENLSVVLENLKFTKEEKKLVKTRTKYSPKYSSLIKGIALFHFISINLLLTFLLYNFSDLSINFKLIYGFIIFISIFGFTSLMDFHSWAPSFEIVRSIFAATVLLISSTSQFLSTDFNFSYILMITYFFLSIIIAVSFKNKFQIE